MLIHVDCYIDPYVDQVLMHMDLKFCQIKLVWVVIIFILFHQQLFCMYFSVVSRCMCDSSLIYLFGVIYLIVLFCVLYCQAM